MSPGLPVIRCDESVETPQHRSGTRVGRSEERAPPSHIRQSTYTDQPRSLSRGCAVVRILSIENEFSPLQRRLQTTMRAVDAV
jgi:hypothetical protein